MKKRVASPRAPSMGTHTNEQDPLGKEEGASAHSEALEPLYPGHQKYQVETLFATTNTRITPAVPGRLAPGLTRPAGATLICDNGELGSFDQLLHQIETWLSARHLTEFGAPRPVAHQPVPGRRSAKDRQLRP